MHKQLDRSEHEHLRINKVQSFNRHTDHNVWTCPYGCMCLPTAPSPAGPTLLSFGHWSAHRLIHSEKTKTHLSSARFYPFAAAFTGRKSINSYQLIHRQVTTGMREHAQYKQKLWWETMATWMKGGGVHSEEVNSERHMSVHHDGPDWFSVAMFLHTQRMRMYQGRKVDLFFLYIHSSNLISTFPFSCDSQKKWMGAPSS